MAAPSGAAPRRLGVASLGFLRNPGLRRALATAGWATMLPGPRVDAIGVWGRKPVARRGLWAARTLGKPVLTIEDGFLRSVAPGPAPLLSLILDDLGVHYDASRPSRLERLIDEGAGDETRAEAGIALLRRLRLSKYNDAEPLADPPEGHVLVVDQTRGDASIAGAGADGASFSRMLDAAKSEHPDAEIVIKTHPETVVGRKPGHFTEADAGGRVRLMSDPINPWSLMEGARAVYVVSSQLGMEALTAERPVRCFAAPFYAGWGATEDEAPTPRRRAAPRSAVQLFAAAYLDYPLYFDPWRGGLIDFEAAVEALAFLRDAHDRNRIGAVCSGARLWKRAHIARFLEGRGVPARFEDEPEKASRLARASGRRHIAWGSTPAPEGAMRMEDGFLRSAGLGAALTPPLSLAFDDLGIYYDPRRESRLERLIGEAPTNAAALARAGRLREMLIRLSVSKYNLKGAAPEISPPPGAKTILVAGQVEDDASIEVGTTAIRTNLALLEAARDAEPDAFIVYKPHPDVEAGLRVGAVAPADAARLADVVATETPALSAIALADEVWTMTSLIGFEALIRERRVVTLGAPFYAGWGLTDDRGGVPSRRQARPSLDQLVHAALIAYPSYVDPVSGLPCPPEVAVERLAAGIGGARVGGRALSKLQGALAPYAYLWR